MSTPIALRLDSSFRAPRIRPAYVIVAILLIGSVGGWLLFSPKPSSTSSTAEVPLSSPSATAVLTAPHTAEGAVTASTSFLTLYAQTIGSEDPQSVSAFAPLIDKEASPNLYGQIESQTAELTKTKLATTLTPMSYKVLEYSADKPVTISIWSVLVAGNDKTAKSAWTTSDISLRWDGEHYVITKWVVRPGPAPENSSVSTSAKADNAASLIGEEGYVAYRTAAADGDSSDVSTQGSK